MGDDAHQNHDEVIPLEGVICVDEVNIIESNNPADYRHIIGDNVGATTRVCIGTATFWCIPSLLQFHCKYFERHIRRGYRFREGADLTAVGFRAAYDWMRLQESLGNDIGAGQVVATLHTAMQLEMRALQTVCYRFLCGAHFREEIAFEVYLKALKYPELEALRKVMLQRIGVHFLAVVGGIHFLQMPLEDVITMISQDSLGVNSEVEVFSALICWLAYRPQEMTKLMPHLTGCVRFTLIPLPVLRKLWDISSVPSSPSDPDGTFLGAFHYDLDMRYRISISITVASLRLLHPNRSEFLRSLRDVGEEAPREWMYDETCSYHLPYPKGPYSHVMNGQAIFSYVSQRANEFQTWARRSRSLLPATNDLQTIEEVPAEFECRESEEEDQNENFLIELQALFLKVDLFLPHEGDPQPYEPEAITFEDEDYPYETYVQETDRQIRGILKELDQNVMPQLSL